MVLEFSFDDKSDIFGGVSAANGMREMGGLGLGFGPKKMFK